MSNLDLFSLHLSLCVGSTTVLKINEHKTVFKSGQKLLKNLQISVKTGCSNQIEFQITNQRCFTRGAYCIRMMPVEDIQLWDKTFKFYCCTIKAFPTFSEGFSWEADIYVKDTDTLDNICKELNSRLDTSEDWTHAWFPTQGRKISIIHVSRNIFLIYFPKNPSSTPGKFKMLYHRGTVFYF